MITRSVHPFDVIARVLVERLQGCEPSEELRAIVRIRDVDWNRVVAHASAEIVLPAFAAALRDLQLTEALDPELGAFLDAVHAANLERNSELRGELAAAIEVLNRADIEPVLLKGANRLWDELYPDHGWRILRDLDLLVGKACLVKASRAFEKAGYARCGADGEVRRRAGACQIELHSELFSTPRQERLLPAADVLKNSRPATFGDGRVRIPSVEHQLMHLIGHSQLRHLGYAFGCIKLRDRLESAALVKWGHEAIDWEVVSQPFVAAGYRRPLLSLLLTLAEGGWCTVPNASRIDRLSALQQRRVALQARSRTFAYIGSRLGWWASLFMSQLEESEGGGSKAAKNLKSLWSERGAIRRMARALRQRRQHLVHSVPYLSWLVSQ
jgi:Uncharacterised nucleotidyltransferase